jgi:hypothetical protein
MSEQVSNCIAETYKHVKRVRYYLDRFIKDLLHRGENHDNSKFEEPELTIFAEKTHKLKDTEYGSEEYKKLLDEVKPAIVHHYSKNRHHPEHWVNGINDMTLIDLLEMLADWKSATERNKDGNIRKSIDINAQKYQMSPQLKMIFENTVREYFTE